MYHGGVEQSALYLGEHLHFGPQATVSRARLMDPSRERGREFGFFEGLRLPHPFGEGDSSANWARCMPTMTSAHATTTTTLTSTVVTCTAVGGLPYVPYATVRGPPYGGLTSVRPVRPAVVSQSVEPSGSFPRALAGSVSPHAMLGNFEAIWGNVSTCSSSQSEFDRGQVASRQTERAVGPGAPGEHYLSHSQGVDSAAVVRPDVVSNGGYGARPKTTGLARQTESAWMGLVQ